MPLLPPNQQRQSTESINQLNGYLINGKIFQMKTGITSRCLNNVGFLFGPPCRYKTTATDLEALKRQSGETRAVQV